MSIVCTFEYYAVCCKGGKLSLYCLGSVKYVARSLILSSLGSVKITLGYLGCLFAYFLQRDFIYFTIRHMLACTG